MYLFFFSCKFPPQTRRNRKKLELNSESDSSLIAHASGGRGGRGENLFASRGKRVVIERKSLNSSFLPSLALTMLSLAGSVLVKGSLVEALAAQVQYPVCSCFALENRTEQSLLLLPNAGNCRTGNGRAVGVAVVSVVETGAAGITEREREREIDAISESIQDQCSACDSAEQCPRRVIERKASRSVGEHTDSRRKKDFRNARIFQVKFLTRECF